MKINCPACASALLFACAWALAGCAGSPPQPSPAPHRSTTATASQPSAPAPRPAPPPPPAPRIAGANWRDLPPTPGSWTYSADAAGSEARFGTAGAGALAVLRCDRSRPAVVLQRAGFGSGTVPATITTSSTSRRLTAAAVGAPGLVQNAAIPFEIAFNVRDPLLDAIAFSRGRFMLEMGSAQTLVLPVWSELGRVIEDCR